MSETNAEEFFSNFENTKYRYFADGDFAVTKGNSDTRRAEWNGEEHKNGEFFTVNGFTGGQTGEFLDTVNAFFIDIDYPKNITKEDKQSRITQLWQDMDGMVFAPTYVIESKNGFHCYWLLKNKIRKSEVPEEKWTEAIKRYTGITLSLIKHWGGDMGAKDITRILRVPGSTHWKNENDPYTVSVWATGEAYEWATIEKKFPPSVEQESIQTSKEFPSTIAKELEQKYPRISRPSARALLNPYGDHIKEGTRNASLHIAATILRDAGKTLEEAFAMFPEYHGIVAERGIRALRNTIRSAYSGGYIYGMNHELVAPHVTEEERVTIKAICKKAFKEKKEADNIRFFRFEEELLAKYPHTRRDMAGQWYQYKDGVYVRKTDDEMQGLVFSLLNEAELYDHKTRSNVADKLACFSAMLPQGFIPDKEKNIINVKNGLLNIHTLVLSPHTPEYVSISQLDIKYNPEATCPRWEKFISEITQEDATQAEILRQFSGLCLTDTAKYKASLMLVGKGNNGKSIFSSTLMKLVGDRNSSAYSIDQINESFGVAGLYGKKLNVIEEISDSYYKSENLKKLISGEPVEGSIKHKQEKLTFESTVKVLFCVNDLPKISDTSEGAYERFIIINFNQKFAEAEDCTPENGYLPKDVDLRETLPRELEGIFVWALGGLIVLTKNKKFTIGEKNKLALDEYRKDNSPLREFMSESFIDSQGCFADRNAVYEKYVEFCVRNKYFAKGRQGFVKELRAIGYKINITKTVNGVRAYQIENIEFVG